MQSTERRQWAKATLEQAASHAHRVADQPARGPAENEKGDLGRTAGGAVEGRKADVARAKAQPRL